MESMFLRYNRNSLKVRFFVFTVRLHVVPIFLEIAILKNKYTYVISKMHSHEIIDTYSHVYVLCT